MKTMNKKLEKVSNIFYKISFVVEFLFCLFEAVLTLFLISDKINYGFWNIGRIVEIIILGLIIMIIIVFETKKWKDKIEKIFLALAIPIGILYMIFILPTYVPDENAHAFRAYQISEGQFISPVNEDGTSDTITITELEKIGIDAGVNKYNLLVEKGSYPTNYKDVKTIFNPTQSNFPLMYIFSGIGFFIGRILNLNIVVAFYLARMLNLIFSITMSYFSIKLIPFGKKILAVYMFTPMYFQLAASISGDCMVNAVTLLFISYVLFLSYKGEKIKTLEKVWFYLLIAAIGVLKYIYIPLVGLSLFMIKNKEISKQEKIRMMVLGIVIALIISSSWYIFSGKYVDQRDYLEIMSVSPSDQISRIIHNPLIAIKVILISAIEDGGYYLNTFTGSLLGWLNIEIKQIIIEMFQLLLIVTPFLDKNEKEFENWKRVLLVLIFLTISSLIIIGLYIGWSPVGWSKAIGIQGRYFIPCIILVLLSLTSKTKNIDFKSIEVKLLSTTFLLNILVLVQVVENFI